MAFLGFLPRWRMDIVKKVGIVLTVPVALWFGYRGVIKLKDLLTKPQLIAFTETKQLYLINEKTNDSIGLLLSDRLSKLGIKTIRIHEQNFTSLPDSLLLSNNYILRLHSKVLNAETKDGLKKTAEAKNVYLLDFYLPDSLKSSYADTLYGYLDFYRFKVKDNGFYFQFGAKH